MKEQPNENDRSAGPKPERESVLWYYLGILRRRVWIIVPFVIVLGTIGAVRAFRTPPLYTAKARLLVERSTPQFLRFEQDLSQPYEWDNEFYETQVQLLRSRAIMEVALELPGIQEMFEAPGNPIEAPRRSSWLQELMRSLPFAAGRDAVAPIEPWEMLRSEIAARQVPETHFLDVESTGGDAARAAKVANAAAEAFLKYHLQRRQDSLSSAFISLQKEKEKQEANLLNAERELQEFREKAQTVAVETSKSDQPAIERLVKINDQLTDVQLARIELNSQIDVMKDAAASAGSVSDALNEKLFALPVIQSNTRLVDTRRALADSQKDLAMLGRTYGGEHPRLLAARAKVGLLAEQFKTALTEVIEAHVNRMKMLEEQERNLQKENDEQKQVALNMAKESFTMARLQGEADRHRRLFDAIVERMREVDISSGLIRTNVQLVERAPVPRYPVNAGKLRGVLFAVVMGLILGTGLAFLIENLDDTIKTPEDLKERLGVPLLGFVPAIRGGKPSSPDDGQPAKPETKEKARRLEYQRRGAIVMREPVSSVAEAYRTIRTSLTYSVPADEVKLISITSCRPQEGKTTTSTNLALSLAQSGKRVLLVDGDLHRPMTHRILGTDTKLGLTSILVGESDWRSAVRTVVNDTGEELTNLHIISAGPPSPNPSELLGSKRMKEFLSEIRGQYDCVLLDTPPVLFVSDACVLGALTDGVILVVRAGSCTRSLLARARDQIQGVNARIIGSILNGMVVSSVGRYYSDYSYHGYSRYAKDYHRSYYKEEREEDREG